MTDQQLLDFFTNRTLPTGRIQYSSFEISPDLRVMVDMALDRITKNAMGANTSREILTRLIEYLEKPVTDKQ